MNFTIVPHEGVGPVKFGMTREEVRAAVGGLPGALERAQVGQPHDYFYGNALRVEYGDDGRVMFAGALFYPGCGCTFSLFGSDPWSLPARELFRLLAKADGGEHTFSASEYVFPNIIVTLWDADSQYDHLAGESRPVYCQVGVGSREYLRVLERWREAAQQ